MPNRSQPLYYARRAPEYEKVYQIPEEQPYLAKLREQFQSIFKNKKVLEIACGTGFWTQAIAETGHFVQATDINEPMLRLAVPRLCLLRLKMVNRASSCF